MCGALGAFSLVIAALAMGFAIQSRWTGQAMRKHLFAFSTGDSLAHWVYSPEEWRSMLQKKHKRRFSAIGGTMLLSMAVAGLFGLLFGLFVGLYHTVEVSLRIGALWFFAVVLWSIALGALFGLLFGLGERKRWRQLLRLGNHVFIANTACFYDGDYTFWDDEQHRLARAEVIEDGDSTELVLHLEYTMINLRRVEDLPVRVRIPVPNGSEDDATRVAAALNAGR